ncbi:MAG TPA: molybdopterin-dependent oxidoreductase, partial [Verrucomicrobiae bacterium]|nr:molybdopterin-dependent oxidoreductase [Verrucomicrobiae bacterium]
VTLPFENGERPLVAYPQKRKLIRQTARPPQLETPFAVFNESIITPNDAFFVRYHLAGVPTSIDADAFRVKIAGNVSKPMEFSIADLKSQFEPVEIVAVLQCSGNSRGFSKPRVGGGQSGNGAMGNARWKGDRLKDVLNKCGLGEGTRQATFNGMDFPVINTTPDFVKALDIDHAMDGEVMLAYEMNGQDLPWLNGYPLRLVVPGYYGTYWVKHVNDINVVKEDLENFWMKSAYRIPDNAGHCLEPGTKMGKSVPINRYNVRSFITSIADGAKLKHGEQLTVRGIAFDGGYGIQEVLFSADGGESWREAKLGEDLGKYSFREWTIPFTPKKKGKFALKVKATNVIGQSQPLEPLWNPSGYMRNVVETVNVSVS